MKNDATRPVDPYHTIAGLYDLEHDPFHDDIDLLVMLANAVGDPILEMGCGSGRILLPLADAGFRVVGLDSSPTMLDRARARLSETNAESKVTLHPGDMEDATLAPGGPFGMVIFSLNSLMHLYTQESQVTALRNAYRALDPRGQLVIDIANPGPDYLSSLAAAPTLEWSSQLADGSAVDKWTHRKIRHVDQVIETTIWYDTASTEGVLSRLRTSFDLRYVHYGELRLMLDQAGFTDTRAYGSYELDPLDDGSDRIFITAEATPGPGIDVDDDRD